MAGSRATLVLHDVRFWRIVLKKSFWGDDQNFLGLLMRFARGDMRDHIASHKNDHGASYERYGVLQWWSRLKVSFCEIFGVVQFSTFATRRAKRTFADFLKFAKCRGNTSPSG
jgi:hypothetical protein